MIETKPASIDLHRLTGNFGINNFVLLAWEQARWEARRADWYSSKMS